MLFLTERSAYTALSRYFGRRPGLYGYRGEVISARRRECDGSLSQGYRVRIRDMDDHVVGYIEE